MKTIKEKALEVIEVLVCDDEYGMREDPDAKLLTTIYTYVHIANGRCGNPHEDWVAELEDIYSGMLKAGDIKEEQQ